MRAASGGMSGSPAAGGTRGTQRAVTRAPGGPPRGSPACTSISVWEKAQIWLSSASCVICQRFGR
jgi:hypothetical protein